MTRPPFQVNSLSFQLVQEIPVTSKPQASVPVIGSFVEWTRRVGGILQYAGVKGFLGNLEEMYESSDESTLQWEVFLQALVTVYGEGCFTVREVKEDITGNRVLAETVPDELADAIEKPGSFQRRLGRAFSKRVGTRYGDAAIHLERAGEEKHATKWRVVLG
jgi:putative DNA primase/helicase